MTPNQREQKIAKYMNDVADKIITVIKARNIKQVHEQRTKTLEKK